MYQNQQHHMGHSGDNNLVRPIRDVLKKLLWLPVRLGSLLNTWRYQSLYITTGLEIKTFARVYVNLEFSVCEKFVANATMVKILATLKCSCVKSYYLIQNLEPAIERLYLPQYFGNKFFIS